MPTCTSVAPRQAPPFLEQGSLARQHFLNHCHFSHSESKLVWPFSNSLITVINYSQPIPIKVKN